MEQNCIVMENIILAMLSSWVAKWKEKFIYYLNRYSQVFFAILIGVFSLGQAGPHFQAITEARAAAYIVWQVIDSVSVQLLFDFQRFFVIASLIAIENCKWIKRWHQERSSHWWHSIFWCSISLSITTRSWSTRWSFV